MKIPEFQFEYYGSTPYPINIITIGTATTPISPASGNTGDPSDHFIALMDILGFTNLIEKQRPGLCELQQLKIIYDTLDADFYYLKDFLKKKGTVKGGMTENVKFQNLPTHAVDPDKEEKDPNYWDYYETISKNMVHFSDTILLFLKASDNEEAGVTQLKAMCDVVSDLTVMCALYPPGKDRFQIMLRGAVAYGPSYIDLEKNIFIGQPIIDAHNLSEGQEWMGSSLHPSAESIAEHAEEMGAGLAGFNGPLFRYKVPLKCEYRKYLKKRGEAEPVFALNWVQTHPSLRKYRPEIEDYDYPRPLWEDLMESNILKYKDWGQVEEYRDNMTAFAHAIFNEFDGSPKYQRKRHTE
jgi:hypothetical protein